MFTKAIKARTELYLLRLRSQIQVERRGSDGRYGLLKSLLAEECIGIALRSGEAPALLTER